ncbi:hypothetical protein FH972_022912 [Carpinus fangiana]|uniref:Diaminopimelate epimerase-like protein n=1 Tax=Carpinus fangiana TaxID=176857 RepID=A0A5N6KU48_9ROSI|nr:hypothetical protein FH972_022912 [Carpinus fangiana]
MANHAGGLTYYTVDVFTSTPLAGNQLAIVLVPEKHALRHDKQRMQAITREFNYSETVFLHEPGKVEGEHGEWDINIFMIAQELPFAGHPTIGTAWLCAQLYPQLTKATLNALAGPIHIGYERSADGKVKPTASIPHDVHQHSKTLAAEDVFTMQPALRGKLVRPGQPIVSIVKGMTFALIEVNSLARLSEVRVSGANGIEIPRDAEWSPTFCGLYFYMIESEAQGRVKVHTRMIELEAAFEDPATGSAASTLAAYLSLWGGRADTCTAGVVEYEIRQGADMGRPSDIVVRTVKDGSEKLKRVELSGTATKVMEGVFYGA